MLHLLDSNQLKDWWAHGGTIFAVFGVIFCLSAAIPEYKRLVKYKNTIGINKKIFVFQLFTAILYFYASSFIFASAIINKNWSSIPSGILFAILNWIASMGNLYVVLLKNKNVRESKELGITEREHYERIYVPVLEAEEEEI